MLTFKRATVLLSLSFLLSVSVPRRAHAAAPCVSCVFEDFDTGTVVPWGACRVPGAIQISQTAAAAFQSSKGLRYQVISQSPPAPEVFPSSGGILKPPTSTPNFSGAKKISLMIRSSQDTSVNLMWSEGKLLGADGEIWLKELKLKAKDGWRELVIPLASFKTELSPKNGKPDPQSVLNVFLRFGTLPAGTTTVDIDDVRFIP